MTVALEAADHMAAAVQIEQRLARDGAGGRDLFSGDAGKIEAFDNAALGQRDHAHIPIERYALLGECHLSACLRAFFPVRAKCFDVRILPGHMSSSDLSPILKAMMELRDLGIEGFIFRHRAGARKT